MACAEVLFAAADACKSAVDACKSATGAFYSFLYLFITVSMLAEFFVCDSGVFIEAFPDARQSIWLYLILQGGSGLRRCSFCRCRCVQICAIAPTSLFSCFSFCLFTLFSMLAEFFPCPFRAFIEALSENKVFQGLLECKVYEFIFSLQKWAESFSLTGHLDQNCGSCVRVFDQEHDS